MQRAMETSASRIRLLASPWSPPAWMKQPLPVSISQVSNQHPSIPIPHSDTSLSFIDSTHSSNKNSMVVTENMKFLEEMAMSSERDDVVDVVDVGTSGLARKDIGYEQSMLSSASPNGLIMSDAIQASWALYISKFISAYQRHGIDIWAITPQNEPEFAAPWEACKYTPEFEMSFINNHLGPRLNMTHPEVLLLLND